jgi:uncharacterized protein
MSVSLHTVAVGSYLQILPSIAGLIVKAEEHCQANSLPAEALTGASLAPDMWPFAKQVFECAHHSARAIAGVRAGVFGPEIDPAPLDFASLHNEIADAIAFLEGVDPGELDGMVGRDMRFEFGTRRMDFTVEDFLLTFSLPNFYFHAASAYGVLRNQGLPIGKLNYLGKLRLKP